jgi:hypothetical protein
LNYVGGDGLQPRSPQHSRGLFARPA